MQKRSKKQQNTLINSVLKAVIGMFFAVPELLHSQASPLQYRCKAHGAAVNLIRMNSSGAEENLYRLFAYITHQQQRRIQKNAYA